MGQLSGGATQEAEQVLGRAQGRGVGPVEIQVGASEPSEWRCPGNGCALRSEWRRNLSAGDKI